MARIDSLRLVAAFVVFGAAGALAVADVPYPTTPGPVAPAASTGGAVYGGWTTPRPAGYGTWTTPPTGGYGGWTTPRPSGYGTWATPPASARALGAPSIPSTPASCDVVAPICAPTPVATVCAPPCETRSPWTFGAFGRYWHPAISGEVLITAGGRPGSGSRVDTQDDLSLDDGDGFEVGASVGYGRHRVFLAYESDSFSGSSVLDRTIVYRGATYPAGEHVDSDLELTFWKLGYDYAFVGDPTAKSGLTMRGGVAAWLWDYDGRLQGNDSGIDESRTFSHVLPVATLAAEGSFGLFHVAGRASGGLLATDRYVVDLEAAVGVTLWSTLSIDVGYRWMNFAFHETTNEADLTLYGPFAGISLAF
jgi:hypothetical protein